MIRSNDRQELVDQITLREEMKTLIVDDSEDMRLLLQQVLRQRGHEVTSCADAETAWEICQREYFPLVILDWLLPGMDGLELCRRLRAQPRGDRSVILIVTSRDEPEDLAKVLDAGANDYLPKQHGIQLLQLRVAIAERQVVEIEKRRRAEEERERLIHEKARRIAAEDAQQRTALLAEASAVLASSLDYEVPLMSFARLTVPSIADWCTVDVVMEDESIHRVAAVHRDLSKQTGLQLSLEQSPPGSDANQAVVTALRTGRTQVILNVNNTAQSALVPGADAQSVLREIEAHALIISPMLAHGRTLGVISLARTEPDRQFLPADLAMIDDLARRAALGVDNARLYREAQRAIMQRDQFISVAAHEIKTPMTILRAKCQLVLRQLERRGSIDSEWVRHTFEMIDQQTAKLSRLVVQLFDMTRIQSGRLILKRQSVDLVTIMRDVASLTQFKTQQHSVVLHAPPSVPASVDPLRLEQVLTNLLDNAIKFSPQGGRIDLEVAISTPETVRLVVQDQGLGIPQEHRKRIFQRFFQAHQDSYMSGMGLGLAISREIVELHGGQIQAEFPPDGGTRFVITLPSG